MIKEEVLLDAKELFQESINKRLKEELQPPSQNKKKRTKGNKLMIVIAVLMTASMLLRFIMTLLSSL